MVIRTTSEVNSEKAAFTYTGANQIATKNETAYTYDADGPKASILNTIAKGRKPTLN
ncbi:hypothetical protein [Kurthia senegalensis]|uniref:hypothetical protein n=1 Tax=Kurthia senegalensis TaxID=1033740 RepID=UPI0002D8203E|nr:hypothetical protein [Kurthia senegalensis]